DSGRRALDEGGSRHGGGILGGIGRIAGASVPRCDRRRRGCAHCSLDRAARDVHRGGADRAPGAGRMARRGVRRFGGLIEGQFMAKRIHTTGRQRSDKAVRTPGKVVIRQLPTGIPGLDQILGGGLPEFSFNIIAGGPGCGKTTMAHQLVFANATKQRPALYFMVLGESAIKMLRYQQQYTFFDPGKLNGAVRFINLSQVVLEQDLSAVLEAIVHAVEEAKPSIVVVDSFRTALRKRTDLTEMDVQFFVQQLALHLTTWEATTFLIGEYVEAEIQENPIFTVADGLFWLSQVTERNSVVRKLQ